MNKKVLFFSSFMAHNNHHSRFVRCYESYFIFFLQKPFSSIKFGKTLEDHTLASQGLTNQAIAKEVGLHFNHVATWRNRFLEALPSLRDIEAGSPEKLADEIKLILTDIKRSGAPGEFTPEQIVTIIDLACKCPTDFGYEVSQWSLPLLVIEINKQGIDDSISVKSVSRYLKMR
ncbi:MAG: helix-turn-helix domain-containing protein [Lachnospiraceae bacterium]